MKTEFLNGVYDGEGQNGVPDGFGVYTASDGSVYKGSFENGELVSGVLHSADRVYIGEFKKMLPHGRGTEYVSRFRKFSGRFNKGKKTRFGMAPKPYNVIIVNMKEPMHLLHIEAQALTRDLGKYSRDYKEYNRCFSLDTVSCEVGFGVLCLNDGYKQAYGYSGNGIASRLMGRDVTGNIIICRDDGFGAPVPFASPEEAERVYDAIWKMLFCTNGGSLYHYAHAVKIAPIAKCSSIFLINDKLYAVEHIGCENATSDRYEGWQSSRPYVSVRVHSLPPATVVASEAATYVAEHALWSDWVTKSKECNEPDTAMRAGNELFEKCIYELCSKDE